MGDLMAYYSLLMILLGGVGMYLLGGFVWWERFSAGYYGTIKVKDIICMIIFLPQSIMVGLYKILKFILNEEIKLR